MVIQESAEMYLKTIFVLAKENEMVRSIDIAKKMNFSKPSVSRAVNNLKMENYIDIDESGYITLTEKGTRIAEDIFNKHEALTSFFMNIGVSPQTADDDACKIEHVISEETYAAIMEQLKGK